MLSQQHRQTFETPPYKMSSLYVISIAIICMNCVSPVFARKMCSKVDDLSQLRQNQRLPGKELFSTMTDGVMLCARLCLGVTLCGSFNFNTRTGACELNDVTLGTEGTEVVHATNYVFSEVNFWPKRLAGLCMNHTCLESQYCQPKNDTDYSCKPWVAISCSDVQQCQPNSPNGEYWLHLGSHPFNKTRIYCHDMSTENPQEYVTLLHENDGFYPAKQSPGCTNEYRWPNRGGSVWFQKIRLDVKNMAVVRKDYTFANWTNAAMQYGRAADCYTTHGNGLARCGTKGRFTIDLRGTGLAVVPEQTWRKYGYLSIIQSITRNQEGTVIELKCGGYCGHCDPAGPLTLQVNSAENIPSTSTTEVTCG
ncbi:A disintegrin and metalloproteinase with thrombospondin motifs 9-like [Haliotis cracherodii]|uniref:A disintegrin and metalloproteinase with thrombospondin motifs 9-like n=1 Tax=Haliotis cracherodii TaxID=6455 RepID=UPI0039EBC9B6